jgi:redox-sensing transcriptional repressor
MRKNKKAVERLFHYKNLLYRLRDMGVQSVYSDTLAEKLDVTASQVRKDFSIFDIKGNKKAGYVIGDLIARLEQILQNDTPQKIIVVGVGRIGSALIRYKGFQKQNVQIVAGFDLHPEKLYEESPVPVYSMEKLVDFVQKHRIRIGVLSVPEEAAQSCYEQMARAGLKGVLNFAPLILNQKGDCLVTSYCVESELSSLIYMVNESNTENEGSHE